MSRFSKACYALKLIIINPWLLNLVLEEDSIWRKKMIKHYGLAHGLPVIRPEDLFGDFTETVDPFAFLDGGSLPTDLALLKKLARRIPGCSYFEIGTWRGESVANVASVAKNCYTLNLSAGEMAGMGLAPEYISQHGLFSRHLKNVTHLEGNSRSFDFDALKLKFDLIFIDGDHHYEMVKNDTDKVFRHLVHDKSVVVWHDYARNPETVRYEVLAGILDGSPDFSHQHIFHVAHTLCAVYLPGYTMNQIRRSEVGPAGAFRVDISC